MNDDKIFGIARGFQASRILLTAVELGVFGGLGDESKPSSAVADALGTDARATDRLMNALVAIGLLEKIGDRFRNSAEAREFLVPGHRHYMGGALGHINNLWDTWSTLTEAVRAGTTQVQREGASRAAWVTPFIAAMHYNAADDAAQIASLVGLAGVRRMLDVGGGSGVYSIEFCRTSPELRAVVFDLPDVVPLTADYVAEAGLSDRITTSAGDFSKDNLGSGFDLVLLSQIIHMNDPAANIELFKKCRDALNAGGRLVIHDFIMDESRTTPPHGAIFALNMLVGTDAGDTYTQSEVGDWLAKASFGEPRRKDPRGTGTTLLIGEAV